MTWFLIILLLAGLFFTIFGFKLLFQSGFAERLRRGIWKAKNDEFFSSRGGFVYDKYIRGLKYLICGLIALGLVVYYFWY